jgi:hypothetical protein
MAGNPAVASKVFNIKINTYPVIVVTSPAPQDRLYEKMEILFDATDSFDPDGDKLTISWLKSTPTGEESLGDSPQVFAKLDAGQYTITVLAKDRVNNQVQETFTITVERPIIEEETGTDTDLDGMFDYWEDQFQTDKYVKDAQEDPDDDGFINLYEFQNNTNPHDPQSHPAYYYEGEEDPALKLFSWDAWPIWALLVFLIVAVMATMIVTKMKKDRQVNRIRTVRNMRKIMPSVSWDQITTTAYMAPMTAGPTLPAAAGPALPQAQEVPADQALPPATEAEAAAQAATPAPEPAPAPAPAPAPEPAPAPAGTVPQPEVPPAQNNLPPQ